jgi:arginyl-tRNA synthetase
MNLLEHLQGLFHQALAGLVADAAPYSSQVKPAQNPQHGDYQANCAMALAKQLSQKPRDVAQKIVESLPKNDLLQPPEIAGPGFINLRLKNDWLAVQLQKMASDERLGVEPVQKPLTYVIDYSSPNVAKPMHVGHLRSTIIGDALARLLRFLGHKVIGDNHLGDWGTQMGQIIWGWKNHRDEAAYQSDPVGELARLYRLSARLIKPVEKYGAKLEKIRKLQAEGKVPDPGALFKQMCLDEGDKEKDIPSIEDAREQVERGRPVEQAARMETSKLHAGDAENRALWKQFMPHCLDALNQVYERLDIHFDKWLGESAYDVMLPGVVKDLKTKGLAVESQGALVVEVEGLSAPFMVQKSDGAFNYATSDLATIQYRKQHFHPDVLLYVVDHRQGDHFKALFDVARRWGYADIEMEHVGFGTIMGQDRKPYKTRDGDVIGLESLLDEAICEARKVVDENSKELPTEERAQVSEIVGLGAVKYADLSQNRTSDYVFDWDKMLALDGNTATYMQYAYARCRSIFRKFDVEERPYRSNPPQPLLEKPEERALAVQLLRFHEALALAAAEYKPNLITAYLWELAKAYSSFYERCPIFKEPRPPRPVQQSRLLLCDLTARVIQRGLDLLGIRTAERM